MKTVSISALIIGAVFVTSAGLNAYERDKDFIKITHSERKEPYSPQKQLESFTLPEGFVIELVASEENGIINPIDLTFDDAGRLWTQTAEMYPMDPFGNAPNRTIRTEIGNPDSKLWKQPGFLELSALYSLKTRGTDRVLLIDDPTKPVEGTVPAVVEGLTMPQSILPYKNGVYIAHGSEMLYFEDADKDGKFEKPNTVLTGFSFIDSHTMSHSLVRGPGGWIHFSHGAMNLGEVTAVASGNKEQINYSKIARFSLDGNDIELVSSGLNNIWGFQLRADGQWYGTEANDKSHSVVPMEPMTGFLGIGNDQLRSYQPMVPVVHPFRVGGTGISGLAFSEDDDNSFPKEWKNVAFLANPITNTINTVRVDRDASGKISGTHLEDLLKCSDEWFRPVNIEFGPDGCLYIADWYNKVVSHNEIPRTDPSRDKSHGRIWRIRHESQKPISVPNLVEAEDEALAQHLLGKTRWEQRAAWHQIADRQVKSLLPEIKKIAQTKNNSIGARVHAIWSYESLGEFDAALTSELLKDPNHNIRREIIRSLASFSLDASTVVNLLREPLNDQHCMVRSQVLRTLEEVQINNPAIVGLLIEGCKSDIPGNELGGAYERSFERFLARKALESYQETLSELLSSPNASEFPMGNLLWASQALSQQDAKNMFPKFWKMRGDAEIDGETLISISDLMKDPKVLAEVQPNFNDEDRQERLLNLTLEYQDRVNLGNLSKALTPALKRFITSDSEEDRSLAINVEKLVQSSAISKEIEKLFKNNSDESFVRATLPLFLANPKPHLALLKGFAQNQDRSFSLRLSALDAYNRADSKAAGKVIDEFVKDKSDSELSSIASTFSRSPKGAATVLRLYRSKILSDDHFDFTVAQTLRANSKKDKTAQSILASATKREQQRIADLEAKVDHYVEAAGKLEGNPTNGQAMFSSCIACHAVGSQGYDIAPALDGSANRELHALITAIVNPDVAVEGGYNLHQVIKKDGSLILGYLYRDTPRGVTIAGMGNTKTFIPKRDIRSENAVTGRSFMPAAFGDFSEQIMVDLVSYIQTLE